MSNQRPLSSKSALITGGSRGLGAATAERLAAWGARVILTYRANEAAANEVVERCAGHTAGARAEQVDLKEEDSVRNLCHRLIEHEDGLDLYVANAAQTAFVPLADSKLHQLDKTFAISVRHFLLMAQLLFPLLKSRSGRIVTVSGADTVGFIPGHGLLAAAKAAMEALTKYLACEWGPDGVTAIGVLPGFIDTDSIRLMAGSFYETLVQHEVNTHPLREAATAADASEAVALLCLPEARWLNGQIVRNDGGGIFAELSRTT